MMKNETHIDLIKKLTRGMTLSEIGDIINVSKSSASKKLQGQRKFTIDDRIKIIKYFDLNDEQTMTIMLKQFLPLLCTKWIHEFCKRGL